MHKLDKTFFAHYTIIFFLIAYVKYVYIYWVKILTQVSLNFKFKN